MMRIYLLLLIFSVSLFSCETVVQIDVPSREGELVINSVFLANQEILVTISRSQGPLDEGYDWDYVTNASVELFEDGVPVGIVTGSSNGNYSFSPPTFVSQAGSSYEVRVTVDGEEMMQAVTEIPLPLPITDALWTDTLSYFDEVYYELTLFFNDPPEESNFYNIQFFVVDPSGSNQVCFSVIENYFVNVTDQFDDFFETELAEYCNEGFFNDSEFNGEQYSMKILLREEALYSLFSFPVVRIVMGLLSNDYYEYRLTSDLQSATQDNPFAQPVGVYSNVEGGFGIFCGLNFTTYDLHF